MVKSYNKCSIDDKHKDNIININSSNIQLNYIGSPNNEDNRVIPLIKLDHIRTTLDDTTAQYEIDEKYDNNRHRINSSNGDPLDIEIQLFANDIDLLNGKLDGGNSIDTKFGLFTINIDIPDENIPIVNGEKVKLWIATWMYDKYPDTRPEQGYIIGDELNQPSLTWVEYNKGFQNNKISWNDIVDQDDEMFKEIPTEPNKYYGIIENEGINTLWFKRNSITNPLYPDETQWQGYINPLVIFLTYGENINEANENYLYGCSNIIKIQLRTERCLEGWSGFPNCDTQCCRSETFPQCIINDDNIINIRDSELREFESQNENENICRVKIGKEVKVKYSGIPGLDLNSLLTIDISKYAEYINSGNPSEFVGQGHVKDIQIHSIIDGRIFIQSASQPSDYSCDKVSLIVNGQDRPCENGEGNFFYSLLASSINGRSSDGAPRPGLSPDLFNDYGISIQPPIYDPDQEIVDVMKFDRNKCANEFCDDKEGEYIEEKISYTCFDDLSENNRFTEVPDAESYCNLEVTAGVDLSLADAALMQSGAANLIQSYNNCNYDKKIKTGIDTEGGECIERRCPKGKFGKNCDNNCCAGICVWPEKYNNPLLGENKTYKEWCQDKKIDPIIPPQRCGCSFDPNELTLNATSPPDYKLEGNYQICTNSSQCQTLPEQENGWTDIAVNINNRNWADSDKAKDTVKEWGRYQKFGAVLNDGEPQKQESGDWGCGRAQSFKEDGSQPKDNDETIFLGCEPVWAQDSDECQYYPNAENNGNGGQNEGLDDDNEIIKSEVCSQCLAGWYGPECNMKCCGGLCSKTLNEKDCAEQSRESNELCEFYPSMNMCLSSCQGDTREDCVTTRGCRWGTDYEEGLKTSPTGDPKDGDIGPYCLNNECVCPNGTPAKGLQCPAHNSESCTSCEKGYQKTWGVDIMSDYFVCRPTTGITNLLQWYLGLIEWDNIQSDFFDSEGINLIIRTGVFISILISSGFTLAIFMMLMIGATPAALVLVGLAIPIGLMVVAALALYYLPLLFNNYIWAIIPKISIPFTPISIGGGKRIETAFLLFKAPYFIVFPILCVIVLIGVMLNISPQMIELFKETMESVKKWMAENE